MLRFATYEPDVTVCVVPSLSVSVTGAAAVATVRPPADVPPESAVIISVLALRLFEYVTFAVASEAMPLPAGIWILSAAPVVLSTPFSAIQPCT